MGAAEPYRICRRESLGPATFLWEVEAPDVARAAGPGQFVLIRLHEGGERIPLTVADFDREAGTVTLVVKIVGKTTDETWVMTEDGTSGRPGTTVDGLREIIRSRDGIEEVLTVGPIGMMQAVAECTRPQKIRTLASMNPIMIDGIGMCGSCRVTVDGKVLFACVDGPDMDAHRVDFEELKIRQRRFLKEEKETWQRYRKACVLRQSAGL